MPLSFTTVFAPPNLPRFQGVFVMKKLILKLIVLPFIGVAFAGCITL